MNNLVKIVVVTVLLLSINKMPAQTLEITNGKINCTVSIKDGKLISDAIKITKKWSAKHYTVPARIVTDGDFGIEIFWTGWRAPGKVNNAEGRTTYTKANFKVSGYEAKENRIIVKLKGIEIPFEAILEYTLGKNDFFAKRSIKVKDSKFGYHQLHALYPYKANILLQLVDESVKNQGEIFWEGGGTGEQVAEDHKTIEELNFEIIKAGSFGQPAVLKTNKIAAFFGMEYPTSTNTITKQKHGANIVCGHLYGKLIDSVGIKSEPVVVALCPDPYVRKWYWNYVESIRVAPAEPYTLYNSWYDLRSVDYPNVPKEHFMNTENVNRMIEKVHNEVTVKNNIKVDAFVLDDGWDVYKSDWKLRKPQFPVGMKPFSEKLSINNTDLGIWFGPAGGYSFRMDRIKWMTQNGYEGIDNEYVYTAAFLCMGGTKYSKLFKKRTVDFVKNHGVKYFKWDGIIFSCNDPAHGHLTGEYANYSIMESMKEYCKAVRNANPDVYLNISTGTWLSPWWTQYANQIWMDAADYAFANVPSLTKRDNAMTYRDFALYDDFVKKDLWFPIANLMTHGIIKGKLDHIGQSWEPIDKFTDNALLYFARGVSMYELYISPDVLSEEEWFAIAQSLKWAKDRKDILDRTEMVGGNPLNGDAYAYAHFDGDEGIIALRNPKVEPENLVIKLSPEHGIDPMAKSLVIEQVYPKHKIFTDLYSAGGQIVFSLQGFETAVFEIYPLEKATKPLIAGLVFTEKNNSGTYELVSYQHEENIRVLNPEKVKSISVNGEDKAFYNLSLNKDKTNTAIQNATISSVTANKSSIVKVAIEVPESSHLSEVGFLLNTLSGVKDKVLENTIVKVDGKIVKTAIQKQSGKWMWQLVNIAAGKHLLELVIPKKKGLDNWKGNVAIWNFGYFKHKPNTISVIATDNIVLKENPPKPWKEGVYKQTKKIGEITIN